MTNMIRTITIAIPSILICTFLSSCVIAMKNEKPTKGRELRDLKEARDSNAITQVQYLEQKNKILNKD